MHEEKFENVGDSFPNLRATGTRILPPKPKANNNNNNYINISF